MFEELLFELFFFFSSRRRHTRFDCDWSSDVCSSDLDGAELLQLGVAQTRRAPPLVAHRDGLDATVGSRDVLDQLVGDLARSEERRVGKECRSRWSPYH